MLKQNHPVSMFSCFLIYRLFPCIRPVIRWVCLLGFVCCFIPLTATHSYGTGLDDFNRFLAADPESPWKITADNVSYHEETQEYRASGNVIVQQTDKMMSADRVIIRMDTMTALAEGNVILKVGEDELSASRMELNLEEDKGVLYNGSIFLKESHFYINGDKLEQSHRYTYSIENARITSCDGENPIWELTGKHLDVTLNGYGVVKHGALRVKNVPVIYTPYFIFPVMLDRQSGFLIPEISLSSRRGFEFDQPLYWAINDNSDLTFYNHYMTKRGHNLGLEYRYVLKPRSKGTFMADFFNDHEIDDGTPKATDDWGYDHDMWDRTNSNRYWVRMKQDHDLGSGYSMKLDLDIVSDQDYLIEFRGGHTGFENTSDYYVDSFGRIIESYEDTTRTNRLNLNKSGVVYSLNTDLKWYDNVIARRHLDEDTTLQKLPNITFNTLKQPLYNSPFYWDMSSEYIYFYSDDGTNGHRMDVYPRFYLPNYRNRYFSFEPSIGLRQTIWRTEKFQDSPLESNKDKTEFRHQYDLKLDLRSELYKTYPWNSANSISLRHTIVPRLVYEYQPYTDQDELPWYNGIDDGINRIEKENLIRFYLTQFLTTRSSYIPDEIKNSSQPKNGQIETVHQLLRFELHQGYDIKEARENNPVKWRNGREKRPFLPLEGEMELMCTDSFFIWADARWCHYDNQLLTRNIELRWQNGRGDQLHLDYRYTDNLLESLKADAQVKLSDMFSVYADYEKNFNYSDSLEITFGIIYDAQCWAMDVQLEADDDDRTIGFMVNLKGLGEIGNY